MARYYGSRWNVETERQELYLEYVDDWNLKYHDLEHWFTARAATRPLPRTSPAAVTFCKTVKSSFHWTAGISPIGRSGRSPSS